MLKTLQMYNYTNSLIQVCFFFSGSLISQTMAQWLKEFSDLKAFEVRNINKLTE